MEKPSFFNRYERQVMLKEIGMAGQQQMEAAKVLVIGAGGLGCPILQYLAGAGVGTLGIVDDDVVALSNLHRQVLYSTPDIGMPKAERAAYYLHQLNPEIQISTHIIRLSNTNALDILGDFDIIMDGTDNFATRYMINDACALLGKPLIYGAISGFEGQVAVFNCKKDQNAIPANYRDLFPNPPNNGEVKNCMEAGVMGVVPGIIGMMMASEAIKLITSVGEVLIDRLLIYNCLNNQSYQITLCHQKESHLNAPKNAQAFRQWDYEWFCGAISPFEVEEIIPAEFRDYFQNREVDIVDIRERHEYPLVTEFDHLKIPWSELEQRYHEIKKERVILFCQSGKRSLQAAHWLGKIFGKGKKVYSLKAGIASWKNS